MKTIRIISPDPEAMRTLGLTFELGGWQVRYASSFDALAKDGADAVLLDLVEGMTQAPAKAAPEAPNTPCIIAIAPRGASETDLAKLQAHAHVLIRRPYELMHLIHTVDDVTDGRKA